MSTLPREVERAVRLVNLEPRSAEAMAAVLVSCGERDVRLRARDVADLRAVVEQLRELFATVDRDVAAERLNALLAAHAGPPRLVRHEEEHEHPGEAAPWGWHVHVDRTDDAPWAEWLAASAALALAGRLAASAELPWGVCAADGCADVFVHDGRGAPRQWCSTTCASRERVRRHRAARRDGGGVSPA